jgi:Zn ribbon nucleic-acid-binding protein
MSLPLTMPCPQCGADMELLMEDVSGQVVVYECTDCGYQAEERVEDILEDLPSGDDEDDEPGGDDMIDAADRAIYLDGEEDEETDAYLDNEENEDN